MRCLAIFLLYAYFIETRGFTGAEASIRNYLADRMRYVAEEFSHMKRSPNDAVPHSHIGRLDFGTSHLVTFDNISEARTFAMFGNNYLLSNGELFYVALEDNKYILTSLKGLPEIREQIALIKSTEHNGIGFLFVSLAEGGVSYVYRFGNGTLEPRAPIQTIKATNVLTDATFFASHDALYLITASMQGHVILYRWKESHFDEVHMVYVGSAIALSLSPNNIKLQQFNFNPEILVVLRRDEYNSSNPYIYEIEGDQLKLTQILDDVQPSYILTFNHASHTYLVVFNSGSNSSLYKLSNNEFVQIQEFDAQPNIQRVFLLVENDIPLIVTVTKKDLVVSTMSHDSVEPLKTYRFEAEFSSIFNIRISELNGEKMILVLGLTEAKRLIFLMVPMSLSKIDIVSSTHHSDGLLECMDQLDDLVDNASTGEVLQSSPGKPLGKWVQMEKEAEMFTPAGTTDAALGSKSFEVVTMPDDLDADANRVLEYLKALEDRSSALAPRLQNALVGKDVIVNGNVLIRGALNADRLTARSIRATRLNGIAWRPEAWLSTTGDQMVTTPLHIGSLKVSDLVVHNDDGLFKDTLSPDGNRTLAGVMRAGSLKAFNIFAPQINDVDMQSLYLRRTPARITGHKSFNNVNADDVHAATLNGKNTSEAIKLFADPKALQYAFQPLVTVKNLTVETINGVGWRNFSADVFRIGGAQTIRGDVTLANVKTQFLRPESVRGVPVEDLLTTATPQDVDSIVHFRSVHAPNVRAQKVNGLDFGHDVAIVANGGNTLISGPVTLKTMRIAGDLAINGSLAEFYKQNHIVGTHERDLLQIYNNNVRINGDLHLANVELAASAKLFISGNEFNRASFDEYWLKTTNQEVPVHFEARRGIHTPHLNAQHLNDVPIDDYMVNDGAAAPAKHTTYVFENVTILGDLSVDAARHHQPDLQKLNAEAVRLNGTYVVRGRKTFHGRVSVESLKADALNNLPIGRLRTHGAGSVDGSKTIRNLTVRSADIGNLTTQQLNGIDLSHLWERAVFVDQPAALADVDFANLTANRLFASKINDKLFNEYLAELNQLHLLETLARLEVKGNASISKVDRVVYINNVNMTAIIEKMGDGSEDEGEPIRGNLYFDGNVHIRELFVRHMNDIDVQKLIEEGLYYRVWTQNVTARHHFKYLHAPNVYTPQINNVRTAHLINVNARKLQVLETKHGLRLRSPQFRSSLVTNITECDAHAAVASIHQVPRRVWRSVAVDALTLADAENPLARLLDNAVSTKKDNVISAPTSLNHVYAGAVFNRKQINGIDLHHIVSDALTYNATDQVVTGVKKFVRLSAAAVVVAGSTQIPIINGLEVTKLDASVLDAVQLSDAPIRGRKTFFGGVQTDHLTTPVAAGVLPENLVSFVDRRPIPKATFDDLSVLNALNIGMVNNVNFSRFLDERLLLNAGHDQIATANYYVDTLQLEGKTTIPSINDIKLDDVVFDEGVQVIRVPKKFTQGVEVQGDAFIEILNGLPLSDLYQQSILLQEKAHILGDVILQAPSLVTGNIQTKSINGVPVDHINELLQSDNHRVRIEVINDALHQIEGLVTKNTEALRSLPHQYLYLERSDDLYIELEHAHDAQVIEKNGGVLMHVHTSLPGETCGLPSDCECPTQETIKIQSSNPHHFLDNTYAERIYSYKDRDIIIDVVTNTKSRSKHCSSNTSQEFTSVNWYTFPQDGVNSKGQGRLQGQGQKYSFPEHITGYVSDVEFFSLDGHVYIILAKLYDASHDTTELDSLVLRISKDRTQVEHVTKLRTHGASTLHVFHTAQGVNMVIGNVGSGLFYETLTTDIYTFDRHTKMFQLLRLVPTTGCTSATSVVLGFDSLIILAQKDSPVQVLKYNAFYQSYYFYETFLSEVPVSSVSVFYTGGFGTSDAYLTAVTEKGHYYIYSYRFLLGWKMESDGQMEGLISLVPLEIGRKQYLFAPSSSTTSTLLRIIKQGI